MEREFSFSCDVLCYRRRRNCLNSLICFAGRVTTLAGGSQGYKDGTGQAAKFHHTAGETAKLFTYQTV